MQVRCDNYNMQVFSVKNSFGGSYLAREAPSSESNKSQANLCLSFDTSLDSLTNASALDGRMC